MTIEIQTVGTTDLWRTFSENPLGFYQGVAKRMKDANIKDAPTISRALEMASPTEQKGDLDAFERMLQQAGIRTVSDPVSGYWASSAEEFTRTPAARMLATEFFARQWRKASFANRQERAILLSGDALVGSFERPYADAMRPRESQQIAPAIPLAELVAMTTAIDSDAYRSYYLTYNAAQLRSYRVGESAEIPIATVASSEHTVRLHKYGRGMRASYEDLRRMRVDKLAWHIRMMAVQAEIDKVAAAITTLVNGDGNSGTTPTSYNLTTLDSGASAGTLTVKGWLSFKMQFAQPYVLTTSLSTEAITLQQVMLNTGSANVPLVAANLGNLGTGMQPINTFADTTRYGWTSDAPANKIVGFDNRFALERVTEIGSQISEMERYVTNQTQEIVMSEVEGYSILDGNATKILTVNA